jgi:hypothetical protein
MLKVFFDFFRLGRVLQNGNLTAKHAMSAKIFKWSKITFFIFFSFVPILSEAILAVKKQTIQMNQFITMLLCSNSLIGVDVIYVVIIYGTCLYTLLWFGNYTV